MALFCDQRGRNFFEICQNNEKYSFSALPGEVSLIDLKNNAISHYQTTFCAPAHFEVDYKQGIVYTSSHNLAIFDKLYYLGPAAIDKFQIGDGSLVKLGTFVDPSAYRFTTHKLFYCKNKPYLCSFGQPNRLYFIDADKLEVLYHDDIESDVLTEQADIRDYLNNNKLEPITLKTIEVSSDGEIIFLLSYRYIYLYSFIERKIISKIPYHSSEVVGGIPLSHFYKRTTHADYLI